MWQVDRAYHGFPGYYYLHRRIPFYDAFTGRGVSGDLLAADPGVAVPGYSLERDFGGLRILRRNADAPPVWQWQDYTPNGSRRQSSCCAVSRSWTRATRTHKRNLSELAGTIRLRSESQEMRLEAGSLNWEGKRLRLSSGAGQTVAIARDDGSQVSGAGLEVDVRRKTIRFTGQVSGTLVTDSDGSAPR